jgi:uroporphyrinogen decarboxylase
MDQAKLITVLKGASRAIPPVWLMRQAGRYLPEYRDIRGKAKDFLDFCYRPELAIEATMQPMRRFDFDAAIIFSDILVVPHGLGARVEFREGEGPAVEPVRSAADVARLTGQLGRLVERLAPVYETVTGVRGALARDKAVIGFAGAPWTVACYLVEGRGSRDFAGVKRWMWAEPKAFDSLIEMLVEATVEHLGAQLRAGADCVQLFDSWAGVLAEPEFGRFVVEPTARICRGLRERGFSAPIIGFPRGASQFAGDYAASAGIDAVGFDTGAAAATMNAVGRKKPVQGNLDPILLVAGGDAMRWRTRQIIGRMKDVPFVFNLGHGIVPETPPAHVADLVSTIRNWRRG